MDPTSDLDYQLTVDKLGSPGELAIERGDPENSVMIQRVSIRGTWDRMPPTGSEDVDEEAVDLLTRWIEGMQ